MKIRSSLSLVAIAVLALGAGTVAQADSTYGYDTAGAGPVSATAKLNISIVVPKVVVLRVGSPSGTQDTLTYNAKVSIPATPTDVTGDATVSATSGNSQAVNWDSNTPTVTMPTTAQSAVAYAWTNGSAVTVVCNAAAFAAGGPTLADVGVTGSGGAGNNFTHPATDLSGCNGVASTSLSANTRYLNTWTYTLGGTPSSWAAGAYSTQVTYTAAGT